MRTVLTRQALRWTPVIAAILVCGCARAGQALQRLRQALPIGHAAEWRETRASTPNPATGGAPSGDAHRDPPAVTGSRLGLRPGETAVQRSLLLQSRLSVAEEQNEMLATRVGELERALRTPGPRPAETMPPIRPVRFAQQADSPATPAAVSAEAAHASDESPAQTELRWPRRGSDHLQLAAHTAPSPACGPGNGSTASGPATAPGPAVSGSRLGILPGSTATERLVETTAKLRAMEQKNRDLEAELGDCQTLARQQQNRLDQATGEIRAARQELSQMRTLLERWKKDLANLRQKENDAKQENEKTFQLIVDLLKELLGDDVVPRTPELQPPRPN